MISENGYTKQDVDYLIPFERDILITIANERKQDNTTEAPINGDWGVQTEAPID